MVIMAVGVVAIFRLVLLRWRRPLCRMRACLGHSVAKWRDIGRMEEGGRGEGYMSDMCGHVSSQGHRDWNGVMTRQQILDTWSF